MYASRIILPANGPISADLASAENDNNINLCNAQRAASVAQSSNDNQTPTSHSTTGNALRDLHSSQTTGIRGQQLVSSSESDSSRASAFDEAEVTGNQQTEAKSCSNDIKEYGITGHEVLDEHSDHVQYDLVIEVNDTELQSTYKSGTEEVSGSTSAALLLNQMAAGNDSPPEESNEQMLEEYQNSALMSTCGDITAAVCSDNGNTIDVCSDSVYMDVDSSSPIHSYKCTDNEDDHTANEHHGMETNSAVCNGIVLSKDHVTASSTDTYDDTSQMIASEIDETTDSEAVQAADSYEVYDVELVDSSAVTASQDYVSLRVDMADDNGDIIHITPSSSSCQVKHKARIESRKEHNIQFELQEDDGSISTIGITTTDVSTVSDEGDEEGVGTSTGGCNGGGHNSSPLHNTPDNLQLEYAGGDGVVADATLLQDQSSQPKVYRCNMCSASFTMKQNLRRHLFVHNLNKDFYRYKCQQCDKCFLQRCDLKRHEVVHTGDYPHVCEECGKGYIRHSDLVVHMRKHNKQKPYACTSCSRCFVQSGDLRKHLRTVHKETTSRLPCSHCDRLFVSESSLIKHIQQKHREQIIAAMRGVSNTNAHSHAGSDALQADRIRLDATSMLSGSSSTRVHPFTTHTPTSTNTSTPLHTTHLHPPVIAPPPTQHYTTTTTSTTVLHPSIAANCTALNVDGATLHIDNAALSVDSVALSVDSTALHIASEALGCNNNNSDSKHMTLQTTHPHHTSDASHIHSVNSDSSTYDASAASVIQDICVGDEIITAST